jgi:hypothetical protein
LKTPVSEGKNVIVVHAEGEEGFIRNYLLMFKSGSKIGDSNSNMNYKNYAKWLRTN